MVRIDVGTRVRFACPGGSLAEVIEVLDHPTLLFEGRFAVRTIPEGLVIEALGREIVRAAEEEQA